MKRHCCLLLTSLVLCLLAAPAAVAQERFQDRLPENTLAYVASSGRTGLEGVRATNPLLRLLASPEMQANWEALRSRQSRGQGDTEQRAVSPEDEEVLELLKAPGLVALLPPQNTEAVATGHLEPVVLFLFDATGQEERIEKLRHRAEGKGNAYEPYEFEGVRIEAARSPTGELTGYFARLDRWLVGGGEKAATENWIRAVRQAPAASLKDAEAFRNARALLTGTGQMEAFLNLPALVDLFAALVPPNPSASPLEAAVTALGLRAFGPLVASVDFGAATTRFELALGRREAAASPLDALAPPAPQFASLSLGGQDALGYSATRVNIQAAWSYLVGAAASLVPPSVAFVPMADNFLQQHTGFTLQRLMSVWGDEVAHFEYAGDANQPLERILALRHRDRARVLAVVEGALPALGPRLGLQEVERVGGDECADVYKLIPKSEAGPAEAQPPNLYLAVTDEWVLVAFAESVLKRTLERAADAPSLADSELYRSARSRFAAELSTFGFMDVEAWLASGTLERFLEQAAAAQASKVATGGAGSEASQQPAPPKFTIPRGYIKRVVTATTQDARGIYHSGYIE